MHKSTAEGPDFLLEGCFPRADNYDLTFESDSIFLMVWILFVQKSQHIYAKRIICMTSESTEIAIFNTIV